MKEFEKMEFSDEDYNKVLEYAQELYTNTVCNEGKRNTGDENIGNWNTGDNNTGDNNTGNENIGDKNTGNRNMGYFNTGDRNIGWNNTGDFNTCNRETGYFNTVQAKTIRVFNKPCDLKQWRKSDKPHFIYFKLEVGKGYEKCFKESYLNAKKKDDWEEQKQLLLNLPNFDKKVFFEISGIDIDEKQKQATSNFKFKSVKLYHFIFKSL